MKEIIINGKDQLEYVLISKQTFRMGSSTDIGHSIDNEFPQKEITVDSYYLSTTTVSNLAFSKFVNETGYITEAERFGSSFVFSGLLTDSDKIELFNTVKNLPWWIDLAGANWKQPEGKNSNIDNRMDHPVVHVSWNDANQYCKWAGGRLPTEAEWELAAKGGENELDYPWGNDLVMGGNYYTNTWQGNFPSKNDCLDGYFGTAPTKEFYLNNYGIYQMIGNVWEWCLNPARISLATFNEKTVESFISENTGHQYKDYAIRGGSFLCHSSYCNRYRVAARNGTTANSTSSNTGFRYVKI